MAARRESMRRDADHLRRAVICEPRGHDALVGAMLTPPTEPNSIAGVIFFNNVGYLGMCGHGDSRRSCARWSISAGFLQYRSFSTRRLERRLAELDADGTVTIRNVAARCHACDVAVDVPGLGRIVGDIAYGGTWFFITHLADRPLAMARQVELSRLTIAIMDALRDQGHHGHEREPRSTTWKLSAPDGRNFVMCPGGAYDRSPCGTGTSAKLATLHARGLLAPGQLFEPESITGGRFTSWLEQHLMESSSRTSVGTRSSRAQTTLRFDTADPFRAGFPRCDGRHRCWRGSFIGAACAYYLAQEGLVGYGARGRVRRGRCGYDGGGHGARGRL